MKRTLHPASSRVVWNMGGPRSIDCAHKKRVAFPMRGFTTPLKRMVKRHCFDPTDSSHRLCEFKHSLSSCSSQARIAKLLAPTRAPSLAIPSWQARFPCPCPRVQLFVQHHSPLANSGPWLPSSFAGLIRMGKEGQKGPPSGLTLAPFPLKRPRGWDCDTAQCFEHRR